jgi:hypothetical protein
MPEPTMGVIADAAYAYDAAYRAAPSTVVGDPHVLRHARAISAVLAWVAEHPEAIGAVREDAQRIRTTRGGAFIVPADQELRVHSEPVHRYVLPWTDTEDVTE